MKKFVKVLLSAALACSFGISLLSCQNGGGKEPLNCNFSYNENKSDSRHIIMNSEIAKADSVNANYYIKFDKSSDVEGDFTFGIETIVDMGFDFGFTLPTIRVGAFRGTYEITQGPAGTYFINFVVTEYNYVDDSKSTVPTTTWKPVVPEIDWKTVRVEMKDNHPNRFNITIEENDPVGQYLNTNY